MAKLELEIKTKVYGREAARAIAQLFLWLGFSVGDSARAGQAMLFVRVSGAGVTKWIWGGSSASL